MNKSRIKIYLNALIKINFKIKFQQSANDYKHKGITKGDFNKLRINGLKVNTGKNVKNFWISWNFFLGKRHKKCKIFKSSNAFLEG